MRGFQSWRRIETSRPMPPVARDQFAAMKIDRPKPVR
jgi:hypothetical protein